MGLQELKDAIAIQAELLDLRADAVPLGEATIIDAKSLKGTGVVVDAVVRWGTLKVGDVFVAGKEHGRVKALFTDAVGATSLSKRLLESKVGGNGNGKGKAASSDAALGGGFDFAPVSSVLPGTPVRILGLKGIPAAGDDVLVVESEERAKDVIDGRTRRAQAKALLEVAAADAVKRAAERQHYQQRREKRLAYEAALAREKKRNHMRRMGIVIPPELQLEPWEVVILREGATGALGGTAGSGANRQQGGQQGDVKMNYLQASTAAAAAGEGTDGAGAPMTDAAAAVAAAGVSSGPIPVPFIIKADSAASLVALQDAIGRIPGVTSEVLPRIVHAALGEATESDVTMASDMKAHLIAFGSKVPANVSKAAERKKVSVIASRVIYSLLDDVCAACAEHLTPETVDETVAVAEVKALFPSSTKSKSSNSEANVVAGCVVTEGTLSKSGMTKYVVQRDEKVVASVDAMASLMHLKDKVDSVKKGMECGCMLDGYHGFAVGDKILAIKSKSAKPKLVVRFD